MLEFKEFENLLAHYKLEVGDDLADELKAGRGSDELLKRLVQGFIWANPSKTMDDRERLAQALSALTGQPQRVKTYDDESVLEAMAEARLEDEARAQRDITFKQRSDRALAEQYAALLKGQHSQEATAERLRKAFSKRLSLHGLRHNFGGFGAGGGLGLPIVGRLLGHSQPSTTARYSHFDADPLRRASNLIGAQLESAIGARVRK